MGGIQAKQKESRDKRQELNDMKKKLGFDSEEEIEKKIREIEYAHSTQLTSAQLWPRLVLLMFVVSEPTTSAVGLAWGFHCRSSRDQTRS